MAPRASAAYLEFCFRETVCYFVEGVKKWDEVGTYLVADHFVFVCIREDFCEDGERERVFHLAQNVGQFVFEQNGRIREGCLY
jgi:hypothetical protein